MTVIGLLVMGDFNQENSLAVYLRNLILDNDEQEASKSSKKEDLMKIIKNLPPAKKKHHDVSVEKSALHVQFKLDHSAQEVEDNGISCASYMFFEMFTFCYLIGLTVLSL